MDWIEQIFKISPDGDSGSLEALLGAAVAVAVIAIAYVRMRKGRPTAERD